MRILLILVGLFVFVAGRGFSAGPAPPITALAIAPEGETVLVGSQAGLEVRSGPDLKPRARLKTELSHIHDLAFAPDGKTLAAAGGTPAKNGTIELYRWPEGELIRRVSPHKDLIYAVSWRADSTVLATASADRTVGLIEAASGKTVRMLEGHSRGVLAAVYLPGAGGLVTAGVDESLRLWNPETGEALHTFPNHTRPVHDLALRPGGDAGTPPLIASVSDDKTVRLWQPTLGRLVRFVRLSSVPLAIAWTRDAQTLLVACKDGQVRVIDPETAEVRQELPALGGVAYCLTVARDGSILVGGQNGQLQRRVITAKP